MMPDAPYIQNAEETEPIIQYYCEYCGNPIRIGEEYYKHNDMPICTGCAKRYAWSLFLAEAKLKTAGGDLSD